MVPRPCSSEHSARMGIVDHHDARVLFGERAQFGQRAKVAVHAEHAIRDEQLSLARRQRAKDRAGSVYVLVWKDLDRGTAQSAPVDDARVVELVGNDDVVLGEDGGHGAGIGREPTLEHDDGFRLLEGREPLFELHVNRHRAGDVRTEPEPTPRARVAASARSRSWGCVVKPEIVVRGEVDDLAVVDARRRLLLAVEDAQLPVEALRPERLEFVGQVAEGIVTH